MNHRHLAGAVLAALVAAACANNRPVTGSDYPNGPIDESQPPESFPGPGLAKGPQPDFGTPVTQAEAPPPISGGTLILTKDGTRAVAADPDRDQVYVVTLADKSVLTIPLAKHDEPGRVVDDGAGHAHVVLRGGGGIATIDIATGTLLSRRATCAAPRGIAFDPAGTPGSPRLLIACDGGEVVAAGAAPEAVPTAFAHLDRDLHDIVVSGSRVLVSRFREAEIIELSIGGTIMSRSHFGGDPFGGDAVLAWRMIAPPDDGAGGDPVVVHQSATKLPVTPAPGGYGGDNDGKGGVAPGVGFETNGAQSVDDVSPGGIVHSLVSRGSTNVLLPPHAVLPVDVAADGRTFAVVAAGNGHTKQLPQVFISTDLVGPDRLAATTRHLVVRGQATSIAIGATTGTGESSYVVLSREPAQLELFPSGEIISLSSISREDTGHAIFHANSGSGLACASCHGEGRDDGHVWDFQGIGPRRTPSLLGTLKDTAPYHWNGEMTGLSMLLDDVMTGRMNGPSLDGKNKDALQSWLFALPGPIAPPAEAAAVERGRVLFTSAQVGCTKCHSGPRLTIAVTVDVGTGGAFQVPSLIGVGARAPYLHDGCATTLADRFGSCGGGDQHGTTSQLTQLQIADLVTYLGTL